MFVSLILASALSVDPGSFERAILTTSPAAPTPVSAPASSRAEDAAQPELSGVMVTVECTAFADGHIDGCTVMEETHPGLGFGPAAVALMNGSEAERRSENIQFARTIVFVP